MSLINYFRETKVEMRQVAWPSRKDSITYTVAVVLLSLGIAALLGFFDVIFSWLLKLVWG